MEICSTGFPRVSDKLETILQFSASVDSVERRDSNQNGENYCRQRDKQQRAVMMIHTFQGWMGVRSGPYVSLPSQHP